MDNGASIISQENTPFFNLFFRIMTSESPRAGPGLSQPLYSPKKTSGPLYVSLLLCKKKSPPAQEQKATKDDSSKHKHGTIKRTSSKKVICSPSDPCNRQKVKINMHWLDNLDFFWKLCRRSPAAKSIDFRTQLGRHRLLRAGRVLVRGILFRDLIVHAQDPKMTGS